VVVVVLVVVITAVSEEIAVAELAEFEAVTEMRAVIPTSDKPSV
jgi:hypothetical protein